MILALIVAIIATLSLLPSRKNTSKPTDENAETEYQMYQRNSSAMPDEVPAAFIHGQPLSLGALFNSVNTDEFIINLYVKNELDREIVANLKADQMVIQSVTMADNLGNSYSCEIDNSFTGTDTLSPEEITQLAVFYCKPGMIPPEIKFLRLHIDLTNWGSYDFQISLDLNYQELKTEYYLQRQNDSFTIETVFYATLPQLVAFYYKDVSVIDDKGNTYPLEYCDDYSTLGRESEEYPYFVSLAERYDPGSFIYCTFGKPIPADVNAITFIYNVRGNTVTQTIKTDTVQ